MRSKSWLLGVILFSLMSVRSWAVEVGRPAPDLVVPLMDGGSVFKMSGEKGKVVLIDFWARWCPPCLEELTVLDRLYQSAHARGLDILAINLDANSGRERARAALKGRKFPAAFWSDTKANGFSRPEAIPQLYLIDRKGLVRFELKPTDEAPLSESNLNKKVNLLLKE